MTKPLKRWCEFATNGKDFFWAAEDSKLFGSEATGRTAHQCPRCNGRGETGALMVHCEPCDGEGLINKAGERRIR